MVSDDNDYPIYNNDDTTPTTHTTTPRTTTPQTTAPTTQTTNPTTTSNPNLVAKANWHVSFIKASNWNITANSTNQIVLTDPSSGDVMTMDYISGATVSDTDGKFGPVSYSFDNNQQKWLVTRLDEETGSNSTTPATPVMTVSGFPIFAGTHRWLTYIVPISHTTFIKVNITGSGNTKPLQDLILTIQSL